MGERRGTKALEAWCKRVTQGYPGVKVENMTTSWRDGLAFCALIHHFRPDLIDFGSLDKGDVIGNNELAFGIAERHLGIPALLDAEDMAEYAVPDRLSILTYLSQFYQVFAANNASPVKKTNDSDSSIASLTDVPSSPNMEGTPPWRELCVVCNHPVYLAQRLRVQGNLYHRTCFRCARCSAQLTLVDYYETHDGKFCCETCPDEVTVDKTPSDARIKASDVDGISLEATDKDLQWAGRPPPTPELSPTTRQSIVAMRRMFFDTDDAKLTRCETLRTDLPPADIPISPNDQVKPQIVHSQVADKLSDSPIHDSVELPNTGACVEYQSDNTSPSPSKRRLDDKSNCSSLNLVELEDKSSVSMDSNGITSQVNNYSLLDKIEKSPSSQHDTDKLDNKAQISPTKPSIERTTVDKFINDTSEDIPPKPSARKLLDTGKPDNSHLLSETKSEDEAVNMNVDKLELPEKHDESVPSLKISEEKVRVESNDSAIEISSENTANGNSGLGVEGCTTDFGESESGQNPEIVEAINENVEPPPRPQRRHKSPKAPPRDTKRKTPAEEYPDDLNPFGDDDEDAADEPSAAGTNPFGSDSDDDIDDILAASTPLTSPHKPPARLASSVSPTSGRRFSDFSPMKKAPSLNPFEDSDEELEDHKTAIPVPLPRKTAPSPEPMAFPRSALRASQRSIASTLSVSSRKKRPAPPPPTPPSPTSTIRSIRSRKSRRAPLPPGMASSRLSLASDTISLGGDSYSMANESISAVADRISEWVETSQLESSYDKTRSAADEARSVAETSDVNPTPNDSERIISKPSSPPVIKLLDDANAFAAKNREDVHNSKNECHIEVPKTPETISHVPSISPIKTNDLSLSDKPLNNKNDSLIRTTNYDNIKNVENNELHRDKSTSDADNIKDNSNKHISTESPTIEHIIAISEPSNLTSEQTQAPKKPPLASRPLEPKISITNRNSLTDSDVEDRLSSNKKNKNDVNMTRKISGSSTESSGGYSLHKSAHGQWRRKKAPAPPLPLNPDHRTVKKDLPLLKIKQELNDIEIKQQGLERQGVALEARIRDKFDSDASITPYVEELVLQLFELVNEKNELFRKQAELMYLRRQQHLEEEQADLEKEIRALMGQPEANKTDSDKELEEQLIQRLVEVVERRDAIVQCLEMDRIREAEEDRSISAQLNVFTKAMAPDKTATSPKKRKPFPDGTKKKWYTLSRSPKKNSRSQPEGNDEYDY